MNKPFLCWCGSLLIGQGGLIPERSDSKVNPSEGHSREGGGSSGFLY